MNTENIGHELENERKKEKDEELHLGKLIGRAIAPYVMMGAAVLTMMLARGRLANSFSLVDYISNPVILTNDKNVQIMKCKEGLLENVLDEYGFQVEVASENFKIEHDVQAVLPSHIRGVPRPYLSLEKNKLGGYRATLHLRKNDRIPEYEGRGIAGHAEVYNYGAVRCPDWQWKDQK